MQPFVRNRHGRLVFPSNAFPELDFSVINSEEQLNRVVRRDFETKAPTGTEMLGRIEAGAYADRYQLMRDIALNLFWTNRFAANMYDKQPARWRDVPRSRDDVFLPVVIPWEDGDRKVAAVESAYRTLPAAWDAAAEDRIYSVLFDVFRHRRYHATELPALEPTVAEALSDPANLTFQLLAYDPDYPQYGFDEILNAREDVPELEALHRWAMVLHNQYPWDRSQVRLTEVGKLHDDDYVVLFRPRNSEVARFIREARAGSRPARRRTEAATIETRQPVRPYAAVDVAKQFRLQPRLEALAVVKGEHPCTNEDVIRNAAYNWSPMSAAEIGEKTGIQQRLYTERDLDDIALDAARAALAHAGRQPQEIGAVIFCSCTSTRLVPSVASWLSGQLGMYQTHGSADVVAACAGLPYGLAEATRILQEVERPVLVVCAEKFSDKIGNVRPSRMIFGDGAAAIVVGPASERPAVRHHVAPNLRRRPCERGQLDHLAQPRLRQQPHRPRSRSPLAGRPLPGPDDQRAPGTTGSRRCRHLGVGHDRAGRPAPSEQDDGHQPGGERRPVGRQALLQHRPRRQHLGRQHPAGDRRRSERRRHPPADPGVRTRFRRRSSRRVRRAAGGSGDRRPHHRHRSRQAGEPAGLADGQRPSIRRHPHRLR